VLSCKMELGVQRINSEAVTSTEMPFGGAKDSGNGTEGGAEALQAYLNAHLVEVQTN